MPYIILALTLFSFGSGYWVGDSINKAEIAEINAAVSLANMKALDMANQAKNALKNAEIKAETLNKQLEQAHDSETSTINHYHDLLNKLPKRPRDKGCHDGLPKANRSIIVNDDEADRADIPEKLARLLQSETYRADQAAVDKNALLKFVQAKCGVM